MTSGAEVFPVALLLSGRRCLVVGGRSVAAARARSLLAAGATVTVVAPEIDPEIESLPVECRRRPYASGDAEGFSLVLCATGDAHVDAVVHEDASRLGVLVNAADDPAACDFYLPAIARRGPVVIAVSTGGLSPAVASYARDRIEAALPEDFGDVAAVVGALRAQLRAGGRSSEGLAWHELIGSLLGAHDKAGTADRWAREHAGWEGPLEPDVAAG